MFVLFTAPLMFFLALLSKKHEGAAWLAGGAMACGFVGALWLAPSLMTVSPHPARRGTSWQSFLRLFRVFVGNGEAIQGVARWIDPDWRNPFSGRTPQQTACWLASLEQMHWAVLGASIAPIAAAFWYGHHVLGFVYVAANVLYNVVPNLVIRDTRRRLLRIGQRSPATAPATASALSNDAALPVQAGPDQAHAEGGLAETGAAPDPGGGTGLQWLRSTGRRGR
jgi:hypothetical protein